MGENQIDVNNSLIPGKILYLRVTFPHDLKSTNKYFIVVGLDEKVLLLKINSEKKVTRMNRNLRECQFTIKAIQYKFLDHDSYIDCSTVWYLLSKEELFGQISTDPNRIVGEISDDHKNEILRLTKNSKSISPRHKKIINQSFSAKYIP